MNLIEESSTAGPGRLARWCDTVVLTAAIPGLGYWIDHADPLLLKAPFPWLIFPPLLIGSRYGTLHGFASYSALMAALSGSWQAGLQPLATFPTATVIGTLLATLIATEFHDKTSRREKTLSHRSGQLGLRMRELVQRYQTLKVSCALMERKLGSVQQSVRSALGRLEKELMADAPADGLPMAAAAGPLLDFFCTQIHVHTAGLYRVDAGCRLLPEPLATFGEPPTLAPDPLLVGECLRTGRVVSVSLDQGDAVQNVLAAIPLADIEDRISAVIVVNEISLSDLRKEQLEYMALLGGRIGEILSRGESLIPRDNIGTEIERSLRRAAREQREYGIASAVVVLVVPPEPAIAAELEAFLSDRRVTDRTWSVRNADGGRSLVRLLALADATGLNGYVKRIFAVDLPDSGHIHLPTRRGRLHAWCFDGESSSENPLRDMMDILRTAAGIENPAGYLASGDSEVAGTEVS